MTNAVGKVRLGVSACLLGENVRYDGQHKLDRYIRDTLGRYVEFVPVCPEAECGLGVPRESMRLVGDPAVFLVEGMVVEVESHEGAPLSVTLPDTVTMEFVEAEPVIKWQTATTSYKPAILENGAKVMVPPHVEAGTRVVVRTADATYVERAKE